MEGLILFLLRVLRVFYTRKMKKVKNFKIRPPKSKPKESDE